MNKKQETSLALAELQKNRKEMEGEKE